MRIVANLVCSVTVEIFYGISAGEKKHPHGANRAVLRQLSHPPCWPHCVVPSRGPGCHRDPLSRVSSIGLSVGAGANTNV